MRKTHLSHVAGLCLIASGAMAETPVLTVYTYDSFTSEWGPGPAVEAAFEETCGCDLQFVAAGDGAALLSRVLLEGASTEADIVLGLDTTLTEKALASGLFAPHGDLAPLDLPVEWIDPTFVPFDWGWFAFVANADVAAPADFEALAAIEKLIKKKIELEAIEFDEDRPRERINTGRRHWDEEDSTREKPAARSRFVPPPKLHDPFFDRPYEASAEPVIASASPEQVMSNGRSISPNIKPKRNVAALFKTTEPG